MLRRLWMGVVAAVVVGFMLVGPNVSPASAASGCTSISREVRKGSSIFNVTLYRMNHQFAYCWVQGSYWTITNVQWDFATVWNIDPTWSFSGWPTNVNWYTTAANGQLVQGYNSNVTGHFSQSWWFWSNNLYPYINLYGDWSGYTTATGMSAG